MKKKIAIFITTQVLFFLAISVHAANPDDVLGVWNTEHNDAKVEIFKCGDRYCGKIVSLKEPDYPAGSKEGTPGTPRTDIHNPDRALRNRPVLGLELMAGFNYTGDGEYKDGTVYDPKKGKTYSGKITLVSPHELDLRGFVGISLLGRTSKWTR